MKHKTTPQEAYRFSLAYGLPAWDYLTTKRSFINALKTNLPKAKVLAERLLAAQRAREA